MKTTAPAQLDPAEQQRRREARVNRHALAVMSRLFPVLVSYRGKISGEVLGLWPDGASLPRRKLGAFQWVGEGAWRSWEYGASGESVIDLLIFLAASDSLIEGRPRSLYQDLSERIPERDAVVELLERKLREI